MVIRGTRTSLARARMIRSARRSRSGKMFSRRTSGNTSSRLNSSSRTNSTSETRKTKQIALYEEVQKAADDMQKTAKALLELGTAKTKTAAKTDSSTTTETATKADSTAAKETSTKTDSATTTETTAKTDSTATTTTTTQTKEKTEEEQKKEIVACVKDLVEQYNIIYKNLDEIGGTVNTVFLSKLKQLMGNCEEELKKTGVSINKDGTLSVTAKTLESTDLNTLKALYCKSNGIVDKLTDRAEYIESNAASTIQVMNRMYGTQSSYNKYGTSSTYYGNNGSWYNAIG